MSLFNDLLQKGKELVKFPQSVNSVVGIDIGTSAIKAVQLKRESGRIVLETYGELALGSYANESAGKIVTLSADVIGQAVVDLMRESNVTTKNTVFSIQSQATLIFVLDLPKVSDSELAQIIPNEARKYIPVPLTEVSLDWYVVPEKQTYSQEEQQQGKTDAKKMEVVIVAVRNETLSQYKQISEHAKVSLLGEEIEIFSAIRSLFHREIAPTMVIDYGAGTTKVSIVEYGVVRAYHVINRGSAFITESLARTTNQSFDEAEQLKRQVGISAESNQPEIRDAILVNAQYIIGEIKSILLQYERQSQKVITKIFLTGGGSQLPGFTELVATSFGVETVHGDPFDKADAPEFMRPVLKQAGPEFTVAVGLALKDFL